MLSQGPPGVPTIIGWQDGGKGSIIVSWTEGFNRGYDQIIHFQISSDSISWTEQLAHTVFAKVQNNYPLLRNTTIAGLIDTQFQLRLFSSDTWGISNMSVVWNISIKGILRG